MVNTFSFILFMLSLYSLAGFLLFLVIALLRRRSVKYKLMGIGISAAMLLISFTLFSLTTDQAQPQGDGSAVPPAASQPA